ncbi:glycoside hydrolase family 15 protein [Arthrobacter sp. ISL-65]|uniref:glycoside hydrolase family 15 protein n=1 Tax=Arthrobacter sp. ISL-65 TaxID=2819112 RepID=UPI001BE854C3
MLCTFWLAQALALAGHTERAREVFGRAAGFATDLGLLAEEVAPDSNELLGNFPQAFSHIGRVNAAWAISTAEHEAAPHDFLGSRVEIPSRPKTTCHNAVNNFLRRAPTSDAPLFGTE